MPFHFIFLIDSTDHPRIQKRMKVMKELFAKKHVPVEELALDRTSLFNKVFNTVLLAAWTSYYSATQNHLDPEQVPMVEEFKKRL